MSTERRRIDSIVRLATMHPAVSGADTHATVGLEALDDCAVVPISPEIDLIVGTDFVRGEGFHLFSLGLLSRFDIGYYLVGANASDLAAMGATPLGLVSVVRYQDNLSDADFEQIMSGIIDACGEFKLPLLGGDTGSYETSVLSATALGLCAHGRALLRSRGRPGDRLFLTGDVGVAGAAIAYFLRAKPAGCNLGSELEGRLIDRWKRVDPALSRGQLLVSERLSTCAIDTSDGLKASCKQIAKASGVDVIVNATSIPIHADVIQVAQFLKVDPVALALGDSVDFRLLFSTPLELIPRLQKMFSDQGWPLFDVGYFREAADLLNPVALLQQSDNTLSEMPGVEWAQSAQLAIDELRGKQG